MGEWEIRRPVPRRLEDQENGKFEDYGVEKFPLLLKEGCPGD